MPVRRSAPRPAGPPRGSLSHRTRPRRCQRCDRNPSSRPRGERGDRPRRQRDAEQLGQRLRAPLLGQELPDIEVDDDRGDPRAVLRRRLRAGRAGALGVVPAPAFPLDQLMLGYLDLHRRKVEDLAAVHAGHRLACQPRTAAAAAAGLMPLFPVRPDNLGQRLALMPGLAARLAAAFAPQRPRRRLGKSLARWRRGGVPRVLLQPGLKLSDPLPGPLKLSPRLRQFLAERHHQRGQHVIRRRPLISGHTQTLRAKITYGPHSRPPACRLTPAQSSQPVQRDVHFPPDFPAPALETWRRAAHQGGP